ncbi:MAG TPA: TetR/AcrR family transcriptional regulator [Alphaproteobacteria bacterium]|nr:TetR/AcrR family transcriptional regulator [Alphaproteobacteria bacterium]
MSERIDKAAAPPRRGGRPTREDAEQLRRTIIDVAREMILEDGYGATSIDAIAVKARIAKRTFYHRFRDKAELFGAVVHDLIERLRPPELAGTANRDPLFTGNDLEQILLRLGRIVLRAALSPQAIALNRVILSEAERFPELAAVVAGEGARQRAVEQIAGLLKREEEAGRLVLANPAFAAEQFLQMITSLPQRRAMGLGTAMSEGELDAWVRDTVRLFLDGCRGKRT